ncbi:hypothetical protein BQ8794_130059 [Mesorhizobium prunaredense]|uniref:Uncharacterized protein n=1 Tax=Mesorhizobium prunaredense TaxID=1631249 RepID=A0A1R3V498_9HYPH|nr:hypothetical protein BQ8794_130059 [Mesorhizobium prunaredense]
MHVVAADCRTHRCKAFETRRLKLRVTGAISETEKIDERARNHFIQESKTYPITFDSNSKN